MTEKESSPHQQELLAILAKTTGHLTATSVQDQKSIQALRENLVTALANENISTVKSSFYSTDNSDIFFTEAIETKQITEIKNLVTRFEKQPRPAGQRVFAREVPVQNIQIKGSVATWANGAAVQKTMGPYQSKDGRKIWFDFYNIEKLIALYISGQPNPALLFNVYLQQELARRPMPPPKPRREYNIAPDTVWIASSILAPNAPSGLYTGLKIKGGKIALNAQPTITNGKITVPPNATVTISLDLDQPVVTGADPTSPYGADARNAQLTLPKKLLFHFSGTGSKIDNITGDIHSIIYGQEAGFKWNNTAAVTYNATMSRVLIPYNCSENTFNVTQCQSPFNTIAEKAEIAWSAWTLPAAQIDITKQIGRAHV